MSATSTSDFGVEMIIDLLDGEPSGTWTFSKPEIHKVHEVTQTYREQNPNDALYVWSPIDSDFSAFDAEYSSVDQIDIIEVWILSLDEEHTARLIEDVINILSQYGNDNESQTNFHRIRPQSAADNRHESIVRKTDHYPGNVQIQLRTLRTTGT